MSWEVIIGIASSIIALCALFLSIWHGYLMRRHNRVSVKPHLTTWTESNEKENHYTVELINNGIGPALIKELRLEVDSKPVSGDGTEMVVKVLKILFPAYKYHSHQSYMDNGYVMAEKEKRCLVDLKFLGDKLPTQEDIDRAIKRTTLRIGYESMYGEKYVFDSDKLRSESRKTI